MDTSEKYIDMCRKATEIHQNTPSEESCRAWFYCTKHSRMLDYNSELEYQWCDFDGWDDFHGVDEDGVVWLPTQEELYELQPSDSKGYSAYWLVRMFGMWLYSHRGYVHKQGFDSIEQQLLAFVMWDMFGKQWFVDKWIETNVAQAAI